MARDGRLRGEGLSRAFADKTNKQGAVRKKPKSGVEIEHSHPYEDFVGENAMEIFREIDVDVEAFCDVSCDASDCSCDTP